MGSRKKEWGVEKDKKSVWGDKRRGMSARGDKKKEIVNGESKERVGS